MNTRLLLGGIKSYLPIPIRKYTGTGGSTTGAYCYSVWLRHFSIIKRHLPQFHPAVVVELGPGDSVGLGLAALLTGSERYVGLDVVEHTSSDINLRVLEELVDMLKSRAAIPDASSFPLLLPELESYSFPAEALNEARLEERLREDYLEQLRAALQQQGQADTMLQYTCPWCSTSVALGSVDLVITQVALQDMDHKNPQSALRENLRAMASWLKPGGIMSHQVDFSCPGGKTWNHHWAFSEIAWKLIRGKRPYFVNRVTQSQYESLLDEVGVSLIWVESVAAEGLRRDQTDARFRGLSDSDFESRAALFIGVKR